MRRKPLAADTKALKFPVIFPFIIAVTGNGQKHEKFARRSDLQVL